MRHVIEDEAVLDGPGSLSSHCTRRIRRPGRPRTISHFIPSGSRRREAPEVAGLERPQQLITSIGAAVPRRTTNRAGPGASASTVTRAAPVRSACGVVPRRDVSELLRTLKASDLRGLAAPASDGDEVEIVRWRPGRPKYVVCNADESEPGTIKTAYPRSRAASGDRGHDPGRPRRRRPRGHHLYTPRVRGAAEHLERELAACRRDGCWVRRSSARSCRSMCACSSARRVHLCEESALLEPSKTKRAEPRNKPPFPGTHGCGRSRRSSTTSRPSQPLPLILMNVVECSRRRERTRLRSQVRRDQRHVVRRACTRSPWGRRSAR